MKKIILLLPLSIILIGSCKKNETNNAIQSNPSFFLIKGMSFYDSIGNFIQSQSMNYNSQGRILLMKGYYPKFYDTIKIEYVYYPDRVIENHFDTNNKLTYKYIYDLNELGLAKSQTTVNYKSKTDSVVSLSETYEYNSDEFMIESYYLPDYSLHWFKMDYQISGSNIFSKQYSDQYGTGPLRICTYFSNSVNTIGNYNLGITWLGKSSKELIKTSAYNTSTPDSMYNIYTFDSQNRVIIEKFREQNPSVGSIDLRITYY
jgi:hypothetical protein